MRCRLWFDVGKDRDTTADKVKPIGRALWFDVGKDRDTTYPVREGLGTGCGLM